MRNIRDSRFETFQVKSSFEKKSFRFPLSLSVELGESYRSTSPRSLIFMKYAYTNVCFEVGSYFPFYLYAVRFMAHNGKDSESISWGVRWRGENPVFEEKWGKRKRKSEKVKESPYVPLLSNLIRKLLTFSYFLLQRGRKKERKSSE